MNRRMTSLEVRRTTRLSPHMVRVVLGGDDLAAFPDTPHTDRYVKLQFPRPGVSCPEPLDLDQVRDSLPRDEWPVVRTYTVRDLDHAAGELTIDFVHHGEEGVAGPWAAAAQPGDVLALTGPGGAYAPDPDAAWHLFVGDESALPAIGAACERVPAGRPVVALLEVADAAEHQTLAGDVAVTWLHRDPARPGQLVDAVRAAAFPAGLPVERVQAFVHGEAGFVRDVRRHLLQERGVPRDALSVSGYWRRGRDEDGWRADKQAERAAQDGVAAAG